MIGGHGDLRVEGETSEDDWGENEDWKWTIEQERDPCDLNAIVIAIVNVSEDAIVSEVVCMMADADLAMVAPASAFGEYVDVIMIGVAGEIVRMQRRKEQGSKVLEVASAVGGGSG